MKLFNYKSVASKEEHKEIQERLIKETMDEIKNDMLNDTQGVGFKFTKYEVVTIGDLVEVECYYHEVDEYYNAIGYSVEVKSQFGKDAKEETQKGFYPIWVGKHHLYAPITFEESYNNHSFANGLGDKATVKKVIRKA